MQHSGLEGWTIEEFRRNHQSTLFWRTFRDFIFLVTFEFSFPQSYVAGSGLRQRTEGMDGGIHLPPVLLNVF